MPPSPALPPEVLIVILQYYTLPQDTITLSTLSLVSYWFRERCQAVLFRSLSLFAASAIKHRERFNAFCDMSLGNPSLPKHVRTLQLKILVANCDSLHAIGLPTFPYLRSFCLQSFTLLPESWENDICRILQLPALEEVSLKLWASLPFNLLVSCSHVPTVSISGEMEFYHTQEIIGISSSVTYRSSEESRRPNALNSLILHNPHGARQIMDNMHHTWFHFSLQNLRTLALNLWEASEHTKRIISLSSASLRCLKVNISGESWGEGSKIAYIRLDSLIQLEELYIQFLPMTLRKQALVLKKILETLAPSTMIPRITLAIYSTTFDPLDPELNGWELIDIGFQAQSVKQCRVTLQITGKDTHPWKEMGYQRLFGALSAKLPQLTSEGRFSMGK